MQAVLKRLPTLSGLICIAAMATRQTNAVWAAFNLGVRAARGDQPHSSSGPTIHRFSMSGTSPPELALRFSSQLVSVRQP